MLWSSGWCVMHSVSLSSVRLVVWSMLVFVRLSRLQSVGPGLTADDQTEPSDSFMSFCETETFLASCAVDEVIVITHARYGRMHISRCVKLDYGHLGCSSNVVELADSRCSGRRRCEIRIPDSEFARYKPCPDDLKPYLQIGYRCLKVQTSTDFCTFPQVTPVTSSQGGHLASLVTEMTGCGGVTTPWAVEVSPGQVIRLTLHDFGVVRTRRGPTQRQNNSTQCLTYAVLREPGQQQVASSSSSAPRVTSRNLAVCGGALRQSVVYVTTTNRLEIGFVRNENLLNGPHYLFEYQALGCPDLPSFQNAWYIRSGDSLTVKCNFSDEVHRMKCRYNSWTGDKWNCTGIQSAANIDKAETNGLSIPYGLSVLIILVIALAIGAFVLCIGLLFLRRKNVGLCTEDRSSPTSPFAGKHFAASTLVRDLTGSMALHPDKLPWPGAGVIGHYGSTNRGGDECYSFCLSTLSAAAAAAASDQRALYSPTNRALAPYYNNRQQLQQQQQQQKTPCGCNEAGFVECDERRMTDVISGSFVIGDDKDKSAFDLEEDGPEGQGQGQDRGRGQGQGQGTLGDYYVLDDSSCSRRSDNVRRVDQVERRRHRYVTNNNTSSSSFHLAEVAKFRSYVTPDDVIGGGVTGAAPKIVSDCFASVTDVDVTATSDSTPEETL